MDQYQTGNKGSQKPSKSIWTSLRTRFGSDSKQLDAQQLSDLVGQARGRWLRTGSAADLDAAISYAKQVVATIAKESPNRVGPLKDLWTGYFTRFKNYNDAEDLDRAVTCEEQALELIQDHPSTIHLFKEIGVGLYLRYQMRDTLADLDDAIMCGETAVVALAEEQEPEYHKHLGSVAVRLSERFARRGNRDDLDQSIAYAEEAINIVPAGDANLASYLDKLISNLGLRFEETQDKDDLTRATALGRRLLEIMTIEQTDRSSYLTNIGNVFHVLYTMDGDMGNLNQAIECGLQALETTGDDQPEHANHVGSLGIRYRDLYVKSGQLSDLQKALEYLDKAVAATRGGEDRATHAVNRAMALHDLYLITNNEGELNQAITQGIEALAGLHKIRDRTNCLTFLCIAQMNRFESSGSVEDLNRAEEYAQQASQELTQNHLDDTALNLSTLGTISRWRFDINGALTDLRKAVLHGEAALAKVTKEEPTYASHLVMQADLLMTMYARTGHKRDLETAIEHCEMAVQLTSQDPPVAAQHSAALGSALMLRFNRDKNPTDLDQSIVCAERALLHLPPNHVFRPSFKVGIAQRYRVRFEREKDEADFQLALQYYQDGLDTTPKTSVDYTKCLRGMSSILHVQYKHTGHGPSLSDAIRYANQAIDATPVEDPERAALFNRLGYLYFEQYRTSPTWEKDTGHSTMAYLSALNCSTAFPHDRLNGGFSAAMALAITEDYVGAEQAILQTLALIPTITFPTNSRDDLQYALPRASGLGTLAASVLYKCGRSPVEAIHALEDSRGIISSLTIDARSKTDTLQEKHPDLWECHTDLQNQIQALQSTMSSLDSTNHARQDRTTMQHQLQKLHQDLENTRKEIRLMPGFSRFLLSPSEKDMLKLAENGSIVCLNSSSISSEAFLITPQRVWVLPLPDLLLEDTEFLTSHLARAGNLSRRDASLVEDDEDEEIVPQLSLAGQLQLLWTAAVKPILQELGYFRVDQVGGDVKDLPRVWWVGRGKMGFAPLHAAGDHTPGSKENTLSHVLSSYATSLKALQFIQERSIPSRKNVKHEMLLVSVPKTPGHDDLNVKDEVSAISKSVTPWASLQSLEYPTKDKVLSALKTCTLAHFACHGAADRVNPAKSALLLAQKDGAQLSRRIDRLTVENLDNTWSTHAQIVYLSACSTAESKAQYLVDEDIHLASSFQLLGFPHVICTLWGADDGASVEVARSFYERLETHNTTDRSVAENLHLAVLQYRNSGSNCEELLKWAPFIHLGC
jgi:tetratricopeptide (TPR) repeat protein